MKQLLLIVSALFVTSFAFAAEEQPQQPAQPQQQPQVVCAEKSIQAAALLFQFNTQQTPTDYKVELVDLAHAEEGGYEVYDVVLVVGELSSSPYRVTASINHNCKIISFETPFTN
ncbi:hypothetical protein [Pseudobdellovibrio sp. HCB154]|uniref:hypothetical protein n=1 Tax=Pseudobdellovibrio sp. HCB154 TaxID=3386277 RepID=UPI0039170D6F